MGGRHVGSDRIGSPANGCCDDVVGHAARVRLMGLAGRHADPGICAWEAPTEQSGSSAALAEVPRAARKPGDSIEQRVVRM